MNCSKEVTIGLYDIITTELVIEQDTDVIQKTGFRKQYVPKEEIDDWKYGRGKYYLEPMNKIVLPKKL